MVSWWLKWLKRMCTRVLRGRFPSPGHARRPPGGDVPLPDSEALGLVSGPAEVHRAGCVSLQPFSSQPALLLRLLAHVGARQVHKVRQTGQRPVRRARWSVLPLMLSHRLHGACEAAVRQGAPGQEI